ncbi:MAG: Arm DNA-binding domain-containing protein [Pseudonocardiaceae bacterium]
MKGHVQRRGKTYRYFFDGDADPLTGKRRQVTKGGFATTVTPPRAAGLPQLPRPTPPQEDRDREHPRHAAQRPPDQQRRQSTYPADHCRYLRRPDGLTLHLLRMAS